MNTLVKEPPARPKTPDQKTVEKYLEELKSKLRRSSTIEQVHKEVSSRDRKIFTQIKEFSSLKMLL